MSECIICNGDIGDDEISWCDKCAQFSSLLVGPGFGARPNLEDRKEINEILSNDRGRTSKRRWRALLEQCQSYESDWAFEAEESFQIDESDPWFITDEQRNAQLEKLKSIFCGRNKVPKTSENFQYFQRGITLPNGSIISMIDDVWAIDGNVLPSSVPYNHILRALTGNGAEQENMAGCDWAKLLTNLILASNNLGKTRRRMANALGFGRNVMRRRYGENPPVFTGANLFLNWINHWHVRQNPPFYAAYEMRGRPIHPKMELDWEPLEKLSLPWVPLWRQIIDDGNQLALMREWAGPSLRINRGRVQLRTIRGGKWIWSQIPPWPRLWAVLSCWALSPPNSSEHRRLRAIQWCWHEIDGELMPEEPERRALTLLRQICQESDKLTVPKDGNSCIYVEGTSGMFYEVGPGPGAHGARFTVKGAPSLEKIENNGSEVLCIHEDGNFKNLPVGDVFASVVLTLIDDLKSSEKLEPLSNFIRHNNTLQRAADINQNDPDWLAFQRNRFNGRRRGNMRWLNTFPAIYRVFVNLPLGSRIRIPRETPNPAIVDDTEVAWMVQNQDEAQLVSGLAQLSGFRNLLNQDGDYVLWERVNVPVEGVRRELVEMLGPYERRHGRPGEPPWWNLFPNPIGPNQLLEQLPDELNRPFGDNMAMGRYQFHQQHVQP